MTEAATIGHNQPPADDPIDVALAPWTDTISEIENWLDGDPIETDAQLTACEDLLEDLKRATQDVSSAQTAQTAPLHTAWKAEIARWKPTVDDLARFKKGLLALIDPLKQRKLKEAQEAERVAREEARKAREEAQAAERAAAAEGSNIDAEREAAAKAEAARQATMDAKKSKAKAPKGMRTVHHHKITNGQEVINWIIANDRPAIAAFLSDYVAKASKDAEIDGVQRWTEKVSV